MKKITIAACTFIACNAAHAQSEVKVFGVIDQFVNYGKTGSTSFTKLQDGGNSASRLGFLGSEDLGGGVRARFMLESGISADTGTGTLPGPSFVFTRQSYVGMTSKWGSIDAGRMYTPLFYSVARADPFVLNAVFSPLNIGRSTDSQTGLLAYVNRANNMVRYRTPSSGPFILDLAYSFGESSTPSRRSGDLYGGRVGWNQDELYIAYSIQKALSGSAAMPEVNPTTSTNQALSLSYNFSKTLRVSANYVHNSSSLATVPHGTLSNMGVEWSLMPSSRVLAGIVKRSVDGSPRGQVGWTLGYNYDLSKRTTLYRRALYVDNRGGASVGNGGVSVEANSGNSAQSIGIGLSHKF